MKSLSDDYDPVWLAGFYDEYGEKEWDRLVRSPLDEVSLHIHQQMLRKYLRAGMCVLEIGAGPGRFTQIMAGLRCEITVADISEGQINLNRAKAAELDFAKAVQAWHVLDICDLSSFADEQFDAVVAYGGPISYVFDRADAALQECRRVLKTDGVFFCSVMSLWGTCQRFLPDILKLPAQVNRAITDSGDLTPRTLPENKHYCRMYRAADFRRLLERNALPVVAMSASSALSIRWKQELAEIRTDEAKWQELLHMESEACAETGCWDCGTHTIAACRKGAAEAAGSA